MLHFVFKSIIPPNNYNNWPFFLLTPPNALCNLFTLDEIEIPFTVDEIVKFLTLDEIVKNLLTLDEGTPNFFLNNTEIIVGLFTWSNYLLGLS